MEDNELFEDDDSVKEDEALDIPKEIRRLNIETHDYPIKVIVDMIKEDDIILRPQYQRDFVWDRTKSSLLIESVLLNIPLPPIYLAQEDDGTLSVIDGLQRLHTFLDFYENKFPLRKLEGEGLVDLNKLTYLGLQKNFPKAKRILDRGNIRTITVSKDSDPDIKYDIFERLNSGSVKLNDQEIRNCIFHGSLNSTIMGTYDVIKQAYAYNGLRHNKILQEAMNLSEAHLRYLDAETVIRILAMITYKDVLENKYKNSMKKLINDYMKEHRELDKIALDIVVNVFTSTMDKVNVVFGNKAFKRFKGDEIERSLNRSIMDCIVISFQTYDLNLLTKHRNEIVNLMDIMLNDSSDQHMGRRTGGSFYYAVTQWTSSKNSLLDRIEMWNLEFDKLMQA